MKELKEMSMLLTKVGSSYVFEHHAINVKAPHLAPRARL